MNSTVSNDAENRLVRRAVLAVAACLFIFGLTACNTKLSENDFEEYCKNLKSCSGESEFESNHGSVQQCVDGEQSYYDQFEGECRKKYAKAVNCLNRNFQCENNEVNLEPCQDKIEDFNNTTCG